MSRNLWFTYVDGREIAAASPRAVLESLRAGDPSAPEGLERFLDVLSIRIQLAFAHTLDVGVAGEDLDLRCRKALVSLIEHGWLRVSKPEATWPPRERRGPAITSSSGAMALA
jgi:hypothetical protein